MMLKQTIQPLQTTLTIMLTLSIATALLTACSTHSGNQTLSPKKISQHQLTQSMQVSQVAVHPKFKPLVGYRWQIIQIKNQLLSHNATKPTIVFRQDPHNPAMVHLSGSTSCNQFTGSYAINKTTHPITIYSTKMACPQLLIQETNFLDALDNVRNFVVHGNRVLFVDAQNQVVLQAQAPH